ncbi:hypothetical protein Pogu_1790 [Pyrobaculum oguniense TE7]|uniref:Ferritin-like domain-containing protein n=1 Tax=Pyrobaculum oguniense (strain DSM 13380 / JCM 10595 / TE7) TaxID=698757 RepID=H6Q9E9_PYROT|nr:hypothetical protein Pogu_1790 [Pyrobaculum oguniense TE7]
MSIAKILREEFESKRYVFDELKRAASSLDFLAQFRDSYQFIDWFKATIDPILEINYKTGALWIRNATVKGIILWTRQGAWNEWAANSALAKLITEYRDYIDDEFLNVFAHQVSDEARHFYIRTKVLKMYGGSMEDFQPIKEWADLFEWPLRCATKRLEKPYFQAKFTGAFQTVELTATVQHKGIVDNAHLNPEIWKEPYRDATRMLVEFSREIEDDESFHWTIAERVWAKYATTPEMRAEILDCAVGALELSTIAKIKRIEAAESSR